MSFNRDERTITSNPVSRGLKAARTGGRVSHGIRAPGAATFNALSVPNISATRRTGVGDNARRLASALSHFSSSLSATLGPMAAEEKQKAEEAEKLRKINEETTRVWAPKEGESPEDKSARHVARHKTQTVTGYDPIIKTVKSDIEFTRYSSDVDNDWRLEREELTTNGFKIPDEEGNPTDEMYTEEDITAMAEAKRAAILEAYPGTSNEQIRQREWLLKRSQSWEEATQGQLNRAYTKQREGLYRETAPKYLFNNYQGVRQGKPQEIWDSLNATEKSLFTDVFNLPTQKDPANKAIQTDITRVDRGRTILKSFLGQPILDRDDALKRLEMMDTIKVGGRDTLGQDKRFNDLAQKIRLQAQEFIALEDRTQKFKDVVKGHSEAVANGTVTRSQLNLEPIEGYYGDQYNGGRKKLKNSISVKEQEKQIGQALIDQVDRDYPELEDKPVLRTAAIMQKLKGTGFDHEPTIAEFSDWKFPLADEADFANNPEEIDEKFGIYMAIKENNPQDLKEYIKDKRTLKAFKFMEAAVTAENAEQRQMTPSEAAQAYTDFEERGGVPAGKDYKKVIEGWEENYRGKLTPEQISDIKERFNITVGSTYKGDADALAILNDMADDEALGNVTFGNHVVVVPEGASPSEWSAKLQYFKNNSEHQASLGGRDETWVGFIGSVFASNPNARLVRVSARGREGYRVFNGDAPHMVDGKQLYISDADINALWAQKTAEEEERNQAAREASVKEANRRRENETPKEKRLKARSKAKGNKSLPNVFTAEEALKANQEDRKRELYQDFSP